MSDKYKLLSAGEDKTYEEYTIEINPQVYKFYFHKKLSLTSWITLQGIENKDEIYEIFSILDNFRLTLVETQATLPT